MLESISSNTAVNPSAVVEKVKLKLVFIIFFIVSPIPKNNWLSGIL